MNKPRAFFGGVLLLLLLWGEWGWAHTPFGQWVTFRQQRLHIGTSRDDSAGFARGQAWAALLAENYPESQALVSRAASLQRLASLLDTQQFEVAVLNLAEVHAALAGTGDFQGVGAQPLQQICATDSHVLVARQDFSAQASYRIAEALSLQEECLPQPEILPLHAGVASFWKGEAEPVVEHEHSAMQN